jgi:hypothetical protein
MRRLGFCLAVNQVDFVVNVILLLVGVLVSFAIQSVDKIFPPTSIQDDALVAITYFALAFVLLFAAGRLADGSKRL